jgi:hypothetical protein
MAVCVVQCSRSQSSRPEPLLLSLSGLPVLPKHRIPFDKSFQTWRNNRKYPLPVHLELVLHLGVEVRRIVGLVAYHHN